MDALPWLLLLGDVFAMALSPVPSTNTDLMALRDMAQAFDGLIVDAGPRGPLHDGERLRSWARALDVFEHAGKPVVLAVDGVCPEDIEVATLERLGVLDEADDFLTLRERLYPRTRAERRAAAACETPAIVGASAAAALARAVLDDGGRGLDASAVSADLADHLERVFGKVGRRCVSFAASTKDAVAFLDELRARPAPLHGDDAGALAECAIATGVDAFWDEIGDGGASGYVSLSEFEELRGERAVDAFLEDRLKTLVASGTTLVAFDGEHRQLARRGVARLAMTYRKLGGTVNEVGYLGDDALLLACAVDELRRRGARRTHILVLSSEDRPCRAAEWHGLATAYVAPPAH